MPRLDQLLASLGYGSRREVRELLHANRVTIHGEIASDPAAHVSPDGVRVDGSPLDHADGILVLLNKPAGLVCSHDGREGPSVYDLLPERWRRRNPQVTSIGRLDRETSGALVLTDRSALVHRLTSPRHKVPKVYRALLDKEPPADCAALFRSGTLTLKGEKAPCAPAQLEMPEPREALITVTEGRYHQVRRMFAAVGTIVLALHRVRFAHLSADDLTSGTWRELDFGEFG